LISGGVQIDWVESNTPNAKTEIWGKNDSDDYVLLYTINKGIATKSETIDPVDLRYYKIRAVSSDVASYSNFTNESSIAMLGNELLSNGTFETDTGWTLGPAWTISGGKLNRIGTNTSYTSCSLITVTNSKYRIKSTISNCSTTALFITGAPTFSSAWTGSVNGSFIKYVIASSGNTILQFRTGASGSNFSIDNISIKRILNP
jgi:hypothetical protein